MSRSLASSHRARRRLATLFVVLSTLVTLSPLEAQTWLYIPQNNLFSDALNWDTGVTPFSDPNSVAVFESSTVNELVVGGGVVGALQFTATAEPYTFRLTTRLSLSGPGVVNASSFRPTFNLFINTELRLLNSASLGDSIVNLSSGRLFLQFGTTSAGSATINVSGGGEILFNGGTTRADLSGATVNLSQGNVTLPSNATTPGQIGSLAGDGLVDTRLAGVTIGHLGTDTTFAGQITGTGPFTKVGGGTFSLTGQITASTTVTVQSGALAIAANDRLGTGASALTLDGGALRYTAAFDDLRALALGVAGGALDTQGFDVTHSAGISGAGTLQKLGSGTLTLDAANTHSGGVRASAGTLALGHDSALGTGALLLDGGVVVASGGARTLVNAATLNADTTFAGDQALTLGGIFTLARNRELTVSGTAPLTLAGGIAEGGGPRVFTRYGSGELILTGASTYTGGTLLAGGVTRINNATGSVFGTGAVTLAADATLTGAGSFSGAFQNNGIYAPGNSPTLSTLSSFSQGSTGVLEMELAGLARGTGYDALDITGSFQPGGTLVVILTSGFVPEAGDSFDLFNFGSVTGTFATLELPDLAPGLAWDTSALYADGVLAVGSTLPEPASAAGLAGLAALAFHATRRRRRA